MKKAGLILLLLLSALVVRGQVATFPVQVNVHALPPYGLYLSDYSNPAREKLSVTLLNRDFNRPALQVKVVTCAVYDDGQSHVLYNQSAYRLRP